MKIYILLVVCLGVTNAQLAKTRNLPKRFTIDVSPFDDVACGADGPRVLTDPSGTFVSPNYPAQYPNSADCLWLIVTNQPNHIIQLDFEVFQTEATYDGVVIYEGNTTLSPIITGFDGYYNPAPTGIRSPGSSLLLRFITDDTIPDVGFSASYTAIPVDDSTPDPCSSRTRPHRLTGDSGEFASYGYPTSKYWNYADCQWLITSSHAGGTVSVYFDFFKTESNFDNVYLFDGDNTLAPIIATLSGNLVTAGPYQSSGQNLFVQFFTDETFPDAGFHATFTSVEAK